MSLAVPTARLVVMAITGVYAAVVIGAAVRVIREHGIRCALVLGAVFPVLHFSYGLGFLAGLSALWRSTAYWARKAATLPLSR